MKDIDINRVDPDTRKTNLQIMKKGDAPYANDGTKVNLHHLIQKDSGTMLEIPESWHNKYSKVLHGLKGSGQSFRNDPILANSTIILERDIGHGELNNSRIKSKR